MHLLVITVPEHIKDELSAAEELDPAHLQLVVILLAHGLIKISQAPDTGVRVRLKVIVKQLSDAQLIQIVVQRPLADTDHNGRVFHWIFLVHELAIIVLLEATIDYEVLVLAHNVQGFLDGSVLHALEGNTRLRERIHSD